MTSVKGIKNQSPGSKSVLVAGGAGFLGSHLVERLINRGEHVICVDDYSTGAPSNISHLLDNPLFRAIDHDIVDPIDFEVDEIYNLACPASPIHYQKDPVKTTETSVIGSRNLLELAARRQAKIFFASTSEVYGDPLEHPQTELYWGNVSCTGVRSCYDEGKRCAESLFFSYQRVRRVDVRVARIFNTYGPRMQADDGRVVSNFIVQALRGQELTVYGDGSQTRSFCYVDDLIDGFEQLMSLRCEGNSQNSSLGPVNLGNPVEFTVKELAELVLELTSSSSRIKFHPLPDDDPIKRKPDITRAKKLLHGWNPRVGLRDGLLKTISYFDNLLSGKFGNDRKTP